MPRLEKGSSSLTERIHAEEQHWARAQSAAAQALAQNSTYIITLNSLTHSLTGSRTPTIE